MNKCDICFSEKSRILWYVHGYKILQCLECTLVYANVTKNDIENAYEEGYYRNVYPDYESDRNIHLMNNDILLDQIDKYFSPGTLLEIGSAFGFFIESATRRGWKTSGYENSKYASHIAQVRYQQNVRNEDFLNADIDKPVDIVCLFDTIEHLLRPSIYIEKISKILPQGGGLIVTTGDIDSLISRVLRRRWRMVVPPLHLYYYSPKTISRLLEKYGFEIVSITHPHKYQNCNSILQYLFNINKNKLPHIPIKINLGDIMLIIAKRK